MSDDRIGVDYGSAGLCGETFGMMITPTVLMQLLPAALCGNSAVRGTRGRIKKPEESGAEPTKVPAPKKKYYAFSIRREWRECND